MTPTAIANPKPNRPKAVGSPRCQRCNERIIGDPTILRAERGLGNKHAAIVLCGTCGIDLERWILRGRG